MPQRPIDLRSDTVTLPSAEMRRAMANAEVGDDVLGADPTAAKLEAELARRLGKEAAVFMPSGTMANQVAIRLHCRPGDELLCESDCHIFNYEQGGFAQLSGVVARTVVGQCGELRLAQLESLIQPDNPHLTRTRLVCLENTHNRGGGHILPLDGLRQICDWARSNHLRTHLDGARLFNAVVETQIEAQQWAEPFDTVSVCFSKGLGAPVGSALAGPRELMDEARRHRKVFGGGMRQSGIIAAGALYALKFNVDRLLEDHVNARLLADYLQDCPGISLTHRHIETNIVYFDVDPRTGTASQWVKRLEDEQVLLLPEFRHRIRALTHLDISRDDIDRAGKALQRVARQFAEALV